ncbi:hypothetical protein AB6A40_002429 [Gnathostoma spinigerum]|uniref:Uncharacterized protein n=1 Tax=Gnathostoma spinigerum TaxID=75299 RepID=A0ABD6EHC9_9BILA
MAGSADAAKNALESLFNKTKEVVHTAAETTKGYANVALGKIIPGHEHGAAPNASAAPENVQSGASQGNAEATSGPTPGQ